MMKKSVIFFGSFLHYSTKVAKALHDSPFIDLVGIVTTPPAPAGKQKVLKKTHTHEWAEQNHINVYTPEDMFAIAPSDAFFSGEPSSLNDVAINKFASSDPTRDHLEHKLSNSSPLGNASSADKQISAATNSINKPDFFVVAGYGKRLSDEWLSYPHIASLNLHFSLLPDFRGANPAEWALLLGETETGVTLIDMSSDFDTGAIITRAAHQIEEEATRESLYEELYDLAAQVAIETIPHLNQVNFATPQEDSDKPYAHLHNRSHGFIDWQFIQAAIEGHYIKNPFPLLSKNLKTAWQYLSQHPNEAEGIITPEVFLERAVRALSGFPGVWTYLPTTQGKKRLKILSTKFEEGILTLDQVQLEGKNPARFHEIKNQLSN